MIKAIVFDVDDTLIHTFERGLQRMQQIAAMLDIQPLSPETFLKHYGNGWKDFVAAAMPGADPQECADLYLSVASQEPCLAVKGVHEMLDALSRKYVLGIATAASRDVCMSSLIRAGIDIKKFSFVFTHDDIGKAKGEPGYFDPVLGTLARFGVRRDEVLFVGDSVFDVAASRNAGVRFVGVLTGPHRRRDLVRHGVSGRMIIPSVMELPRFIEQNGFSR